MHATLATLIDRLEQSAVSRLRVIPWSSPVPSFGDLSRSTVASLGLNPSNREFVDDHGRELDAEFRRFHTLRSLQLRSWSDIDAHHLRLVLESCQEYFFRNPYDRWFRRLDAVISGTGTSFYDEFFPACHLDLIPFATACKWTDLEPAQRTRLLRVAGDTLALLLRHSPVRLLVINGQSVVDHFQALAGIRLERIEMPEWSLPRLSGPGVLGVAYRGVVDALSGLPLGNRVMVLGYNHNLQSSFGVTNEVVNAIRRWIGAQAAEALA
ncbi:MAG TPA: hypothetical protein VE974_23865 [Thermoanaerobaculia bacterium]|nr:hypothetical protein [Thermoanaerobaculia bacterium]